MNNVYASYALLGLSFLLLALPFVVVRSDRVLDLIERSETLELLVFTGLTISFVFGGLYIIAFLFYSYLLVPASCTGWILFIFDLIVTVFAVIITLLESG